MDSRDPPHRKRIHHYEVWRESRLLTFSCYRRLPLLLDEVRRELVGNALAAAITRHGWLLVAFVFMPEHVHLSWAEGASGADRLLFAIKRPSSFRIRGVMERGGDPELPRLMAEERPGITRFRFWQEGPGHDRNSRDHEELSGAIAYIHENPVRRGLCASPQEWTWSSARQYRSLPNDGRVPRVTRWRSDADSSSSHGPIEPRM